MMVQVHQLFTTQGGEVSVDAWFNTDHIARMAVNPGSGRTEVLMVNGAQFLINESPNQVLAQMPAPQ